LLSQELEDLVRYSFGSRKDGLIDSSLEAISRRPWNSLEKAFVSGGLRTVEVSNFIEDSKSF
jgi:hypothetical protein